MNFHRPACIVKRLSNRVLPAWDFLMSTSSQWRVEISTQFNKCRAFSVSDSLKACVSVSIGAKNDHSSLPFTWEARIAPFRSQRRDVLFPRTWGLTLHRQRDVTCILLVESSGRLRVSNTLNLKQWELRKSASEKKNNQLGYIEWNNGEFSLNLRERPRLKCWVQWYRR